MGLFTKKLTIEYMQEYLREQGIWATREGNELRFSVNDVTMYLFYDGRLYIRTLWELPPEVNIYYMSLTLQRVNGNYYGIKAYLAPDREDENHSSFSLSITSETFCSSRKDFRVIFGMARREIVDTAHQTMQWYEECLEHFTTPDPSSQTGSAQNEATATLSTDAPTEPAQPAQPSTPQAENLQL